MESDTFLFSLLLCRETRLLVFRAYVCYLLVVIVSFMPNVSRTAMKVRIFRVHPCSSLYTVAWDMPAICATFLCDHFCFCLNILISFARAFTGDTFEMLCMFMCTSCGDVEACLVFSICSASCRLDIVLF